MLRLLVELKRDRRIEGRATLFDVAPPDRPVVIGGPWPCLGRAAQELANAAGNPERLAVRKSGDTPTGRYAPARLVDLPEGHRLGPCWLPLSAAADGDAVEAIGANGRRGLGINAGRPRRDGKLIPTEGCVRVDPETILDIERLALGRPIETVITQTD